MRFSFILKKDGPEMDSTVTIDFQCSGQAGRTSVSLVSYILLTSTSDFRQNFCRGRAKVENKI